jgi:beta-xylosidase
MNKQVAFYFLFLLLFFHSPAKCQNSCVFNNPVLFGDFDAGDPTVAQDKNVFYLTFSSKELPIYESSNMVDWVKVNNIITERNKKKILFLVNDILETNKLSDIIKIENLDFWAPEFVKVGKKWKCYVTTPYALPWNKGNYLLCLIFSSKKINSTWKFDGVLFTGDNEISSYQSLSWNAIDVYLIKDKNNNPYLFYGSNGVYAVKLNARCTKIKGKPIKLSESVLNCEASMVFYRNGYYYLFNSIGGAKREEKYRVIVTRSKNILGEYKDKEGNSLKTALRSIKPILQGNNDYISCGHVSNIIEDKNGNSYLLYGGFEEKGSRRVFLQRLIWGDDGWPYFEESIPKNQEIIPIF